MRAFGALHGSRTAPGDRYGFNALWLSVSGIGLGFSLIPAMDAALGTPAKDRAGSGSGLLLSVRRPSSAVGITLVGSLLAWACTARLDTRGLPRARPAAPVAGAPGRYPVGLRRPVAGADAAFVRGLDAALAVCGIAALATAVLVVLPLLAPEPATAVAAAPDAAQVAPAPGGARQ